MEEWKSRLGIDCFETLEKAMCEVKPAPPFVGDCFEHNGVRFHAMPIPYGMVYFPSTVDYRCGWCEASGILPVRAKTRKEAEAHFKDAALYLSDVFDFVYGPKATSLPPDHVSKEVD